MKSKTPIITAVLPESLADLERHLKIASKFTDSIHLDYVNPDFCDGKSIAIESWPHLDFRYSEVHLMDSDPTKRLEDLKSKGVTRALVHIESKFDVNELAKKARELDILLGFAVNPDTDLVLLKPVFNYSTYIQVMGVRPGHYGQKMDQMTSLAVKYLKSLTTLKLVVSVDGGVRAETIPTLKNAGTDFFVINSAIFGEGEPEANYQNLLSIIKDEPVAKQQG